MRIYQRIGGNVKLFLYSWIDQRTSVKVEIPTVDRTEIERNLISSKIKVNFKEVKIFIDISLVFSENFNVYNLSSDMFAVRRGSFPIHSKNRSREHT